MGTSYEPSGYEGDYEDGDLRGYGRDRTGTGDGGLIGDAARVSDLSAGTGSSLLGGAQEGASGARGQVGAPLDPAEAEARLRELSARRRRRGRRRVPESDLPRRHMTAEQRLILLDTWLRSALPAKDFAAMVGLSTHTLYLWKQRFQAEGPAGLMSRPRGRRGSRVPDTTKRAILMLKRAHPDWGQDRIAQVLMRGPGFAVSPGAVGRVLEEEGYVVEISETRPHPDKPRSFERARPNELWQTDLFSFVLKREGRRVHLVAFMDDQSRFIVGFGLHATASGALVREVFERAITDYGAPKEVLTDNGTQYVTWRGKSAFTRLCERRGIKQIVARPRHPETLGKIERFWGTLWRELLEAAIFRGIEDARARIGHFIDHYDFQRPHQGIGGQVPADRYFEAAAEVRGTLEARVAANALELARDGEPRKSFYLTGRVGDTSLSLHGQGERVVLVQGDGRREEVDLGAVGRREEPLPESPAPLSRDAAPADLEATLDAGERAPGTSPLDALLGRIIDASVEDVSGEREDDGREGGTP